MAKKYKIEVEGRGEFPSDMLRYDRAQFATPLDEITANEGRERRWVTLICDDRPTYGRWRSFTWAVVREEQV